MSVAMMNEVEVGSAIPKTGQPYVSLPAGEEDGMLTAHAVQTILAEPQALYELWKQETLFPRWQEFVVSVTPGAGGVSHWVTGDPEDADGKRVEFDSRITEDAPGAKIAWESITPEVPQHGYVTFEKVSRGTLVTLVQTMKVPGGSVGNAIAGVAKRSPKQVVIEDLRHFKQLAETGEIPSVKGQPHGPRGVIGGIKEWMYGETNPTPPGTSEF